MVSKAFLKRPATPASKPHLTKPKISKANLSKMMPIVMIRRTRCKYLAGLVHTCCTMCVWHASSTFACTFGSSPPTCSWRGGERCSEFTQMVAQYTGHRTNCCKQYWLPRARRNANHPLQHGCWSIVALWDDGDRYRKSLLNQGRDRNLVEQLQRSAAGRSSRNAIRPRSARMHAHIVPQMCTSHLATAHPQRVRWHGPFESMRCPSFAPSRRRSKSSGGDISIRLPAVREVQIGVLPLGGTTTDGKVNNHIRAAPKGCQTLASLGGVRPGRGPG